MLVCAPLTFQQITFKLGSFTNLKAFFPAKLMDIPELIHVKSWKKKKCGKVYYICDVWHFWWCLFSDLKTCRLSEESQGSGWVSQLAFWCYQRIWIQVCLWFSYFLTCNELLVLTRKKQQLSTLHVKTLHKNRFQERAHVYSFSYVLCAHVILLARYVI